MHTHTNLALCTQVSMHMQTHMDIFSLYKNTHSQSFETATIRNSLKGAGYHRVSWVWRDPYGLSIPYLKNQKWREGRQLLCGIQHNSCLLPVFSNSGVLQTEVAWGTG